MVKFPPKSTEHLSLNHWT